MSMLDAAVTNLAICWCVERSDGAGLGLTGHDAMLVHDGRRFEPGGAILPHRVRRSNTKGAGSEDVGGAVSNAALSRADLSAGRWDGACVELFTLDWASPSGKLTLVQGAMGAVECVGQEFEANLSTTFAKLEAPAGPQTSPLCRAALGDRKCRVNLAGRKVAAVVVDAQDVEVTVDRGQLEGFAFGQLRWLDGPNRGLRSAILSAADDRLVLRELPAVSPVAGERVELVEGCDKTFATCSSRFSNAVNFRGEPHLPGADILSRYPGA
ncbi:DUF2163 domain-containing protein [Sphingomicrobium aestuariivivum]|uniref:DUF2163 domain-containing protein n=1 Tax=Sphingomicrobium aestuariivivum TaxID=1582356 RepID=UPI001FD714B4|nr:DUF2163 domain-containing protein [Sphingomicrobium aestuariivivum]MCJ8191782.1 DUF2163 domain-containing protein [Sphingomicrobium aestuariivivum]